MQNTASPLMYKKILTYDDVVVIPQGDSSEPLMDVRSYDPSIIASYDKPDMLPITGEVILVRDSLARKLAQVNASLAGRRLRLKIVYGYRHPDIQQRYFEVCKSEMAEQLVGLDEADKDRYIHNFVAVPDAAGHTTGGAVDLTIVDDREQDLDMGTAIADYTDPLKIQTFADGLNGQQVRNRRLLHDLMVSQGFAPFYGEWWHFSYGDREWAAFYNQKIARYGAISFKR